MGYTEGITSYPNRRKNSDSQENERDQNDKTRDRSNPNLGPPPSSARFVSSLGNMTLEHVGRASWSFSSVKDSRWLTVMKAGRTDELQSHNAYIDPVLDTHSEGLEPDAAVKRSTGVKRWSLRRIRNFLK